MAELFNTLNLNSSLVKALERENITIPTDVQQKVIPEALKNKDIIAQSETGSGKTLAYLLPLYEKVDSSKKEMQAIVLVPTHELAIQILRQIELLSQNSEIKISGMPVIGNVNITRQIEKLKERPNIIVGSPGRILELIKKKKISAHTIKTIIVDEADRLMDDSNIDDVKAVIKSTQRERQLLMFSATMPDDAINKAKELMKEPDIIRVEEKATVPPTIEHIYFKVEQRDKIEVLRKLVRILNPEKAIVFVNKNDQIINVTEKIKYHGLKAESIHGTGKKLDRKNAMEEFKAGKAQLLIASDIAARGLDIEGVTHIFNMDIPEETKDYVHRAGRTGRNGNSGVAVSIATERELPLLKKCENALKISIAQKDMYMGNIIDAGKRREQGGPQKKREPAVRRSAVKQK